MVSAGAAATTLPWLLCSLHAGHIVDRYRARHVFWLALAGRAVVVSTLVVALLAGIAGWVLVAFAFVLGVLEVFAETAATTLLPSVVAREHLVAANARIYGIEVVMNTFVGISLGAWLFGLGPTVPFAAMLALCVLAAILATTLGRDTAADEPAGSISASGVLDGVRYVLRHRLLLTLAIITSIANFSIGGGESLLVFLVKALPDTTELHYGFAFVALSAGSLVGFPAVTRLKRRFGDAVVLRGAIGLILACLVGLVLASAFWLVAISMGLLGLALTLWGVIAVALRQEIVPTSILGRVNAFYRMIAFGSAPIGSLASGALAQAAGLSTAYVVLIAMVVLGVALLPRVGQRWIDRARAEAPAQVAAP